MEKVLRAMDVIPPFDSHCEPHRGPVNSTDRVPLRPIAPGGRGRTDEAPLVMISDEVLPATGGREDIPTLDLGEKILAEQRRTTARTRRAPGAAAPVSNDFEDETPSVVAGPVEAASDDVAQLQQIVAEIVARDIERLCQGLKR